MIETCLRSGRDPAVDADCVNGPGHGLGHKIELGEQGPRHEPPPNPTFAIKDFFETSVVFDFHSSKEKVSPTSIGIVYLSQGTCTKHLTKLRWGQLPRLFKQGAEIFLKPESWGIRSLDGSGLTLRCGTNIGVQLGHPLLKPLTNPAL